MKPILFLLLTLPTVCFGSQCPTLFPYNIPIVVENTTEVCKSFFVVIVDSTAKRPLLSSEYHVPSKDHVKRTGSFYNNTNYALTTQNYPTGYDRGHLTPAANAATLIQMKDTFDLINSAPQIPSVNRGVWAQLEEDIREQNTTPVWIVTGVIYGSDLMIPTHFFKIVYRTDKKRPQIFIAENKVGSTITQMRLSDLRKKTRISFK